MFRRAHFRKTATPHGTRALFRGGLLAALVAAVATALMMGMMSPAQAASRPVVVNGHSTTDKAYKSIVGQHCGFQRWFWQKSKCTHQRQVKTFDKGRTQEIPRVGRIEGPGTSVTMRTARKGRYLVGVDFLVSRAPFRQQLCDWRVDLEYIASGSKRPYLIDRGKTVIWGSKCIVGSKTQFRKVLPRFKARVGQVCGQLYVNGHRRPERVCTDITR